MSATPPAGVDAALQRLILEQRVTCGRAHLRRAVGDLQARVGRAGALVRAVRARPRLVLAAAFAAGLVAGLARGRLRS